MAENRQPSCDYFPLNDFPVHLQLGMYEYVDGRTANELRKVDTWRRLIIDGNPRIFENKRLIPSIKLYEWPPEPQSDPFNAKLKLCFTDYCNSCSKHSSRVLLSFENRKCVSGVTGYCDFCHDDSLGAFHDISSTSPIFGLSLEECSKLATKGAKVEKLTLSCIVYQELVESIRHIIDSSLHIVLDDQFTSADVFDSLVQEPRGLTITSRCGMTLNDAFFRTAGQGTLEVDETTSSLSNERLAILAGRNDLTHINLHCMGNVAAAGVKRAVEIVLESSFPKDIKLAYDLGPSRLALILSMGPILRVLELDAESTEVEQNNDPFVFKASFVYGGGRVKVDFDGSVTPYIFHIVSRQL